MPNIINRTLMLPSTSIAGLIVTKATKQQVLQELSERLARNLSTFIVTPYSEFLYASLKDPQIQKTLNSAHISISDGVGIQWASVFLHKPLTAKNKVLRTLQCIWQVIITGANILVRPTTLQEVLPEKIVGADFVWDLSELAAQKGYSVYILGGFGDTPAHARDILVKKFPQLRIAGISNKQADDPSILEDVSNAEPDFLFVALGPLKQEQWIVDNMHKFPSIKLGIGLGATFDYITGAKQAPPTWVRNIGLEWLFRLITQPYRYKRIYNATLGLIVLLIKYKLAHVDETKPS